MNGIVMFSSLLLGIQSLGHLIIEAFVSKIIVAPLFHINQSYKYP